MEQNDPPHKSPVISVDSGLKTAPRMVFTLSTSAWDTALATTPGLVRQPKDSLGFINIGDNSFTGQPTPSPWSNKAPTKETNDSAKDLR